MLASESDAVALVKNGTTSWSVPWSSVTTNGGWKAETESLPMALDEACREAIIHLKHTEDNTNLLGVGEIRIKRPLSYSRSWADHGISKERFNSQWFLAVRLYPRSADVPLESDMQVVMLLNHTFADKRQTIASHHPERAEEPSGGDTKRLTATKAATSGDPNIALAKTDFIIPAVQWNCVTEPLPIDLNAQIGRARRYLMDKGLITEPVVLEEIQLWSFLPIKALEAQKLDISQNRHHWGITLRFGSEHYRFYEVHMLLDGRILSTGLSP
jgi:hypothetical protein